MDVQTGVATRLQRITAMLAQIGTGTVSETYFAPGARWWSNGGMDLPIAEFAALLSQLHATTREGIAMHVRGVTADGNRMAVEAESHAVLVNGRVYHNRYHFVIVFDGDLIGQVREYSDTLHAQQIFGVA